MASTLIELLVVVAIIGSVALLTPSVRAQTVSVQTAGDLILGFRADGGIGAGVNLEVDLGSVSNFYNGASSGLTLTNLATQDLIDTYGANWSTRTDLWWGAAATDGNAGSDPNGKPPSTLWATGAPGNAPPLEGSSGAQSTPATKITGLYLGFLGSLDAAISTTNSSSAAVIQNSLGGSWSVQESSGNSFTFFNPKIDGHVSSAGTLNFYELEPSSAFPKATGTLIGSFILNQSGLSFHAGGKTNSAPLPVASFTATSTNGPAPLAVTFADTSGGSPTSWNWTFGDTGTSTNQNPNHTYASPGTFTASLVAVNASGASTNLATALITVGNTNSAPLPVASFTATSTNGPAPLAVTFTDTSSGSPTSWNWTFGDTGTSTNQNPSHTYASPGTFTASLIAVNASGASTNLATALITVGNTNSAPPPVASFIAAPTNGPAPLTVSFVNNSTGTITNEAWAFGDGGTSSASSPVHTYTNAGVFSVSLLVVGPSGSNTLNLVNLIAVTNTNVPPTPPALAIVSPSDYQAFTNAHVLVAGTASAASGIKNVTVNGAPASLLGTNWFTDVTLVQGTNAITAIATDNSPAMNTATQVVHAVLSPLGAATNQAPVIISAPAVTNAVLCLSNACVVVAGETNVFSVEATDPNGAALSYQWSFGDGVTSDPSPLNTALHAYIATNCGPYNASVTVSDGTYSTNASLIVSVPCALDVSDLRLQAKFKKTGSDTCSIKGTLTGLPEGFSIANAAVSLDVGGATVDIQLNEKGSGANRNASLKFSRNKKTGVWTFTGKLKGDLKGPWATYGITNGTVIDSAVTFPVLLMLQSDPLETFDAELGLTYSNSSGTSGTATFLP